MNEPTLQQINEAKQRMAALKVLKDWVLRKERTTKAFLLTAMSPGDRANVEATNGDSLATISLSKDGRADKLVVTDPETFAEWLEPFDPKAVRLYPREWAAHDLALQGYVARNHGELPPGVDIQESGRAPALSIRQTGDQVEATMRALLPEPVVAMIEGRDQ